MVLNKYKDTIPSGSIFIGRPSKYGNPFVIGRDGDRDAVVLKFIEWAYSKPEFVLQIRRELKGKNLVCFCSPALCHGHVLEYIANS